MEQVTDNGKVIVTFVEPNTAMYRIKFTTGGELPIDLRGVYTSEKLAALAISKYLAKQPTKKEKNA